MQTFNNLYKKLDRKSKSKLIITIISELEISDSTFRFKRNNQSFNKLEREKIAEILSIPPDVLFPEIETEIS